tara:strand:+ start:27255 stop:27632 length:378 start_codon:yes stop_codon:yes gene_type:complete
MDKGQGKHRTANEAGRCGGGTPTPTAVATGSQGSQWVIEDQTVSEGVFFFEDTARRLLASLIARQNLAQSSNSSSCSPHHATGQGGGAGAEDYRPVVRDPGLQSSDHGPVIAQITPNPLTRGAND